ncbi:MAG: hypothetical protein WAS27_03675 [Candidatus Saccharimonadales bacterium]
MALKQNSIEHINSPDNERLVTAEEAEREIELLERIPTDSHDIVFAITALDNLVKQRNLHQTGTFPISGNHDWSNEPNPTNEQLKDAAEAAASVTLHSTQLEALGINSQRVGVRPDNEGILHPSDVQVASNLVDVAIQTRDPATATIAQATLDDLRGKGAQDIADELQYRMHHRLGTATPTEEAQHEKVIKADTELDQGNDLDRKIIAAIEQSELPTEMRHSMAEEKNIATATSGDLYNPFADE